MATTIATILYYYSFGPLVKFYLSHFARVSCDDKSTVTYPR